MTLLDTVKPAKLHITAFLDSAFTRPLRPFPNRMSAAYNPESLSIKQDNTFENRQGASTSAAKASFYASSSRLLTVTFAFVGIDFGPYGLNASQLRQLDVREQLDLFQRLCQRINGASHQPSFLRLNWGKGGLRSTFEARLKSYEISYGLFDRGGKALLADLTATFVEAVHPTKRRARQRLSSPDLSHRHLVLAGETLPMLCQRYYGTPDPYLQVAAFNQLDDLRDLTPGQELLFPPLESAAVNS
ncbi:MAG: hypothetical protein VKO39_13445 [Cyanobacteriota bacterium]|nr:hypothetical protein [Cyanobacteriota bacterium]